MKQSIKNLKSQIQRCLYSYQTKPKFGTKVLQILYGQGFHFLFSVLKPSREYLFLIAAGICSQIFGPKQILIQFRYRDYGLNL